MLCKQQHHRVFPGRGLQRHRPPGRNQAIDTVATADLAVVAVFDAQASDGEINAGFVRCGWIVQRVDRHGTIEAKSLPQVIDRRRLDGELFAYIAHLAIDQC